MKYRVVLRASYIKVYFDYDEPKQAIVFMTDAIEHLIPLEDGREASISLIKVYPEEEKAEEEKESEEN